MGNNSGEDFDFVDVAETETEPDTPRTPIIDQQQQPQPEQQPAASKKRDRRGLVHKDWAILGLCLGILLLACFVAILSRHVRELNQEVEELTGTVSRYRSHDAGAMGLLASFRQPMDKMASRLCGNKLFSRWC